MLSYVECLKAEKQKKIKMFFVLCRNLNDYFHLKESKYDKYKKKHQQEVYVRLSRERLHTSQAKEKQRFK